MNKIALVTGANRGLGNQIAKSLASDGCIVYGGVKKLSSNPLCAEQGNIANLKILQLDVESSKDIDTCVNQIISEHKKIDILINNAGIYPDDTRTTRQTSMLSLDPALFSKTLRVNVEGPLRLIWKILPIMKHNNFGRIVNVSSGKGRFEDFDIQGPFYRISKIALNALTVLASKEVEGYNILVNSVCPGWVRTDMGGKNAPRSVEKGAETILAATKFPSDGPNGIFLRDGNRLDWCKIEKNQ